MKPLPEQNFYEIFEIQPNATRQQIEQAYELAKKTYGDNSLASYSLFDSDERKEIIRKIHLAYETLSDEDRRKQYDQEVLGIKATESLARPVAVPVKTVPSVAAIETSKTGAETVEPVDIDSLTGLLLRQIRERQGLPLQEIANKTRINITYFEFLERNQYRSLPPSVYLRSYVLQYARMLGLDPARVADRVLFLVDQSRKSQPS